MDPKLIFCVKSRKLAQLYLRNGQEILLVKLVKSSFICLKTSLSRGKMSIFGVNSVLE